MPDIEKFDVYRIAIDLHARAVALVPRREAILKDQLERASLSVVLNIAEAVGRRGPADKKRVFAIAYGSASESRALLDVLDRRKLADPHELKATRALAVRVIQMLVKLTHPARSNTKTITHTHTKTKTTRAADSLPEPSSEPGPEPDPTH